MPSATSSLIFSGTRESAVTHAVLAVPEVPGPHECPESPRAGDLTPAFVHNFDTRVAGGATPLTGAEYPELLCWVRHLDATGVADVTRLMTMSVADLLDDSFASPAQKQHLCGIAGLLVWRLCGSRSVHWSRSQRPLHLARVAARVLSVPLPRPRAANTSRNGSLENFPML